MSEWQHVITERGACWATVGSGQSIDHCDCTTPTPDPSSPCGYKKCGAVLGAHWHQTCDSRYFHHPHIPTRCTCGHDIKEADHE